MLNVIASFGDQGTEDVYNGDNTKAGRACLPKMLWAAAGRKLDMLNAAHHLADLRVPPGNQLEQLQRNLKGWHSIRINDQYRIIFRFAEHAAMDVKIVDYH